MKAVRKFANSEKTAAAVIGSSSRGENEERGTATTTATATTTETAATSTTTTTDTSGSSCSNNQPNTFFNIIESANGSAVEKSNIWASS
jgi:hypothetical protein